MRNKSGEEKLFSIWWLVSVMAVMGFVVAAVSFFYSGDYDSREAESRILANKFAECLINLGELDDKFSSENFNDEIYDYCNLKKEFFLLDSDYYFRINISGSVVEGGRKSFEKDCGIYLSMEKKGTKNLPACTLLKENVILNGGNSVLEILTASNNRGRRVLNV